MGRINNDAAFFMSYVRDEDRGQAALLPAAIEDYVAADAPVRVIDAFVDGLEVRSSRRLERECSRNVEVMWLLRRLAPDFKTIADFRSSEHAAFEEMVLAQGLGDADRQAPRDEKGDRTGTPVGRDHAPYLC
jgi:transposase